MKYAAAPDDDEESSGKQKQTQIFRSEIEKKVLENSDSSAKPDNSASFVQLNSIFIRDIKQFKEIESEIIEDQLMIINEKFNAFLASEYLSANDSLKSKHFEESMELDIGKDINAFVVEMQFVFHELLWNGNTAYIKINDSVYWMDHHNWEHHGDDWISKCEDNVWTNPIRVVYRPYKEGKIKLLFGIKVDEESLQDKTKYLTNCVGTDIEKILEFKLNGINIK